jgi:hypothetical protein
MKIARVFPRKTKATPNDDLSFFDVPGLFPPEVDEVHVSVTFTWDINRAERLAHQWEHIAPIKFGGPAYGNPSGEFVPGLYVKPGYVITSRGCQNNCWFCSVWRREPKLIELQIHDGFNILDDNLLACSENHIRSVFEMLKRQNKPVEFTGGLEAALLKKWHIDLFLSIRLKQMFFAYDTKEDLDPLFEAAKLLEESGLNRNHKARCYVLIGYPTDTFNSADLRLRQTLFLGYTPMAMLWRNKNGDTSYEWRKFQRKWARPAIIHSKK